MTNDSIVSNFNNNNIESSKSRNIQVSIEFSRIGEIDTMNEKYQAEFNILSQWIENEAIDEYDVKKFWSPQLYVENALQLIKEDITYEVQRLNDKATLIIEKRYLKGVFWERLELQNFPFDIQELSITLSSKLTHNELRLVSNNHKMSFVNTLALPLFIDQQKWRLYKLVKVSEHASYDIEGSQCLNEALEEFNDSIYNKDSLKIPKIVATCYVTRRAEYYIFNGFFLIFLITFSAITIFSIDCKLPQNRLQVSYTLLLTSVSFKWVVNRSLPTVSYLTSLDKYAIACIFYICLLCLWHSIVGSTWTAEVAINLDKISLVFFTVMFIIFHIYVGISFYISHKKITDLKKEEYNFLATFNKINFIHRQNSSASTYYNLNFKNEPFFISGTQVRI